MQMQSHLAKPSTRDPRMVMNYSVKPPGFHETLSSQDANLETPANRKTWLAYAAFFALSALRSRLLLAASGPLSVSRSQSHQVKELE